MRAFVRRHPLASYIGLAFAISWGGILAVVGPTHVLASKETFESLAWVPPLLLGPSTAGLVVTALLDGRSGMRALGRRLGHARVAARWYLIALLAAPVFYLSVTAALSRAPALVTTDDPAGAVVRAFVVGLAAGVFEELGWTGFAVPHLLRRHSATRTGAIVGLVWGLWHVVPKLLGQHAMDTVDYAVVDVLATVVSLTGFRILMVWVYARTQSLLVAIVMHAGLAAGLFVAQPAVTGIPAVTLAVAQAVGMWLLVGLVAFTLRQRPGNHRGLAVPRGLG